MEKQYVAFRLAGQLYGAPIDVVREVNYLTAITRLPNTPAYVDGVMDLRGEILPVVNLRRRLNLPDREADTDTRLLILNLEEHSTALVVDGVDTVLTLDENAIVAPDRSITVPGQDYVVGVARSGEKLVIVLDLPRLMA